MKRYLYALSAAVVLTACEASTKRDPYVADYLITVGVSPSVASVSAPTTVTTTVTNQSAQSRPFYYGYCGGTFRAALDGRTLVPVSSSACSAIKLGVVLAPGESFSLHQKWDGRDAQGAVVPGRYLVYGQPFASSGPISAPVELVVVP